jgi:hypothetical protein
VVSVDKTIQFHRYPTELNDRVPHAANGLKGVDNLIVDGGGGGRSLLSPIIFLMLLLDLFCRFLISWAHIKNVLLDTFSVLNYIVLTLKVF